MEVDVFSISLINQIVFLMKKKYIFPLLFISFLFAASTGYAQQNIRTVNSSITQDIEGLTIYPNPVTNNKIFITSTLNDTKQIDIYDVLGKKVMSETLIGKELNVSELNAGVYILKIRENKLSATRKLVVR